MNPEEVMTMIAQEHSYDTWTELIFDSHPHWVVYCTKEAMERYANYKISQSNPQDSHNKTE